MTPNERANQVLLQFSFEGKRVVEEAEFLTVREIELAQAYLALESRIQKLEAVVEAAARLRKEPIGDDGNGFRKNLSKLYDTLIVLERE